MELLIRQRPFVDFYLHFSKFSFKGALETGVAGMGIEATPIHGALMNCPSSLLLKMGMTSILLLKFSNLVTDCALRCILYSSLQARKMRRASVETDGKTICVDCG